MSRLWDWVLERFKRPETEPVADPDRGGLRPVEASEVAIDTLKPSAMRAILTAAEGGDISGQAELFERMVDRDGLLGSHLNTRRMGVRACGWEILPDDAPGVSEREAEKTAQFCRDVLAGIDAIDERVDDLLGAVGHGFAVKYCGTCPKSSGA